MTSTPETSNPTTTANRRDDHRQITFKRNIMERMGGENMFEFVVLNLVQLMKEDPKLERYFEHFTAKTLHERERAFLTACFTEYPDNDDSQAVTFIALRHYDVIDRGFCGKHFDILVNHLVVAMDDSWVPADVERDVLAILKPFRKIFATEAEMEEQNVLNGRLITDGGDDGQLEEVVVPMKDGSEDPPSRERKQKPTRRRSGDGMEKLRKTMNKAGRRPSFEALTTLRKSVGKTLSGEGLRKMTAKLKEGSKDGEGDV